MTRRATLALVAAVAGGLVAGCIPVPDGSDAVLTVSPPTTTATPGCPTR